MDLNFAVEIIAIGAGIGSAATAIVTKVLARRARKEREVVQSTLTGQKMSQKIKSVEQEEDRGGAVATPKTGKKISRKNKRLS